MSSYGVVDLSSTAPVALGAAGSGELELSGLASQLEEIRDALQPVLDEPSPAGGFGLQSLEVALTIGLEGKVWFVASGSAEASVTLTFGKPAASG